jgi:localization factor PodJL
MRAVPWQVKGVHPDAQDTAREAARRAGISVGEWLNAVIKDHAAEVRRGDRVHVTAPRGGDDIAGINERLNELARRLDHLMRTQATPHADPAEASHRLADAITRLDQRLGQLVSEDGDTPDALVAPAWSIDGRLADVDRERRRAPDAGREPSLDDAVAEIAARQRALDDDDAIRVSPALLRYAPPRCRADAAVEVMRKELADIARALSEALPRRALEALESEVRMLAGRIDAGRASGIEAAALAGLEQGLREVRDALRALAPAESLVGFEQEVRALSHKIDTVAAGQQDGTTLQQLEAAITLLRGAVGHVASGDALAALTAEVRALAEKVEQGMPAAHTDMLANLEQRIASIADAIETVRAEGRHAVPANLDHLVKSLSDKLEHMQATRGEQVAISGLEDRIARLVEKLDASEARLGHLETIERGMAELLVHLEALRARPGGLRAAEQDAEGDDGQDRPGDPGRHATAAEVLPEPRPLPSAPPIQPIQLMSLSAAADRTMADRLNVPAAPPAAPAQSPVAGTKAKPPRPAIDPSLPPDHPLEPGSGPPRARTAASPSERIAASEAALRAANAVPAEAEPKANFLQAARRAAQRAAQGGQGEHVGQRGEAAAAAGETPSAAGKLARITTVAVGVGVVVILAVVLRFAASYFDLAGTSVPDASEFADQDAPVVEPAAPALTAHAGPRILHLDPDPSASAGMAPIGSTGSTGSMGSLGAAADPLFAPVAPATSASAAKPTRPSAPPSAAAAAPAAPSPVPPTAPDVTGTVAPPAHAPAPASGSAAAAPAPTAEPPAGPISSSLLAAAMGGNAAAAFEVATRYAEGRGVSPNMREAAGWFERAAKTGLAPAQFRLGTLYEKGNGVTKDLNEARRLYLAAAEKRNANAMHNLGVLYAEGIDGKPDFRSAGQWFRKAAAYGVADSQYNLAVLYARGLGVERNLSEAYKWFALAAQGGDQDAAKKRDEVAGRLEAQTLAAARRAVESWTAEAQPEEATTVKAPPGGWDQPAPAAKAKSRMPVQTRAPARMRSATL